MSNAKIRSPNECQNPKIMKTASQADRLNSLKA